MASLFLTASLRLLCFHSSEAVYEFNDSASWPAQNSSPFSWINDSFNEISKWWKLFVVVEDDDDVVASPTPILARFKKNSSMSRTCCLCPPTVCDHQLCCLCLFNFAFQERSESVSQTPCEKEMNRSDNGEDEKVPNWQMIVEITTRLAVCLQVHIACQWCHAAINQIDNEN